MISWSILIVTPNKKLLIFVRNYPNKERAHEKKNNSYEFLNPVHIIPNWCPLFSIHHARTILLDSAD